MNIQNRLVEVVTEMIEEPNVSPEFLPDPLLMISAHRNRQRRALDQFACQLSLPVKGGINPLFQETSQDHRVDLLRCRFNAG